MICHLLEFAAGTLKQAARSTFTAETLSAIAAMDNALVLAPMLHEIITGPSDLKFGDYD